MKDMLFRHLQEPVIRNVEGLAIIQTCKKVDGEVLTTGTFVANDGIHAQDEERFGIKVQTGTREKTEVDLSRGTALNLAAAILENFGMSTVEFAGWVSEQNSENPQDDSSMRFLVS